MNQTYSYTQSNNQVITITGSGAYSYSNAGTGLQPGQYNCILFDVELATASGPDMVQSTDLTNLFKYIKQIYPDMIIITAISHSCSYYIPTLSSEIIKSNLSDYIAPILYSQMFGTANEYIANNNLSWLQFFENLSMNSKFKKYGLNYLLPNIYAGYPFSTSNQEVIPDMYNNGGSNSGNPPNLYYYQSSSNANSQVTETYGNNNSYLGFLNTDEGVIDFFNKLSKYYLIDTKINTSQFLGGFVQWSNYYSLSYSFDPPVPYRA